MEEGIGAATGADVADADVIVDGTTGQPINSGMESLMTDTVPGAGEAQTEPGVDAGQEKAPVVPAVEAPTHWPADHRAEFAKLTPQLQKFYMDRHNGMEAGNTRKSQEFAPFRQLQERWAPHLQANNVQLPQVADTAMQFDYAMRSAVNNDQKMDVLFELGKRYGVDFSGGGQQQFDDKNDQFGVARQVQQMQQPLQQQMHQITQTLSRLAEGQTSFQQTTQQQNLARANQMLVEFRDRKDAKGQLEHPYFADVEQDMKMLGQAMTASGQQLNLDELYKQACWMNPAVRTKMQQRVKPGASQTAAQGAYSGAAGAGGGLTGSGGTGPAQAQSTQEILEELWPARA